MTGQQLCDAACDGDAAKVSMLLSGQGAQSFINYQGAQGNTPLLAAAYEGHASVTKQLIEARCNIDHQDDDGNTPLHLATYGGHVSVTEQLIEARCNCSG